MNLSTESISFSIYKQLEIIGFVINMYFDRFMAQSF